MDSYLALAVSLDCWMDNDKLCRSGDTKGTRHNHARRNVTLNQSLAPLYTHVIIIIADNTYFVDDKFCIQVYGVGTWTVGKQQLGCNEWLDNGTYTIAVRSNYPRHWRSL